MPKDKINYLNNTISDNNKRNSIFKSSYNINDSQPISNDCNKSIKTIVQPRTPSSYVYQKIQSKAKPEPGKAGSGFGMRRLRESSSRRACAAVGKGTE